MNTFVFLFCNDPAVDPVAPEVLQLALERYDAVESSSWSVGGRPVFESRPETGLRLVFVPTRTVASYQYPEIAADLNAHFADAALISVVNWHAGGNAPQKVLCAHTSADVTHGCFPPAPSAMLTATLHALENARKEKGLTEWRTLIEASHWSGTPVGRPPSEILDVAAPVIDLEIGSYPEDWRDRTAHEVLVETFGSMHRYVRPNLPSVVFCGGIHFEPCLSEALLQQQIPVNLGLVLSNQWLVEGNYGGAEGDARIIEAVRSVLEPVSGLCFHDGLKSSYKTAVKDAAEKIGIPVFNHRKLRDPDFMRTLEQKLQQ